MRFALLGLGLAITLAAPALAAITTGAELNAACVTYNQGADEKRDPCRRYLEGYFRILADRNDADFKARAQNLNKPGPARPCVRMPDKLTYRAFSQQIAAHFAANPALGSEPAIVLADKTLEANYPCPDQGPASKPAS
ncbi:MAG TPA: hypothetical protein DCL54_13990 [Alphaproteobacteria bacterium]|nr:hypothetical protein [Alphaproteobacteria bacterium]HAJ47681.1 hypothetical protein [Alphaproteobacteria bacterium]